MKPLQTRFANDLGQYIRAHAVSDHMVHEAGTLNRIPSM